MSTLRASILLVEDEPEIRRFLRASLGAEGYRVVESATGRRGTIDAGTHKPDLAIVDLGLPDMEGIDVIRQLRQWSSMPIIVLSARVQEQTKVEALDAGADLERRTARRGDDEVRLTPIEYRLLGALAKHAGMVATHRQLLADVWGP